MGDANSENQCECERGNEFLFVSSDEFELGELAARVFAAIVRDKVRFATVFFEPEEYETTIRKFCSMVHHLLSRHGISSELKLSAASHGFTHFVSGASADFSVACWVSPRWEYLQFPESG